jgi:hypothetical protein
MPQIVCFGQHGRTCWSKAQRQQEEPRSVPEGAREGKGMRPRVVASQCRHLRPILAKVPFDLSPV